MDVSEERMRAIRDGEEAMARRIALAYEISKPVSPLAAIIPGRFIYDAVMRERQVTWSKNRYIPPRLEAFHLATRRLAGESPDDDQDEGDHPRDRLVERLTQHYEHLLKADGKDYKAILLNAFPRPVDLEVEWKEIGELEEALDEKTIENHPGDEKLLSSLNAYRSCAEEQRGRLVQELYYA